MPAPTIGETLSRPERIIFLIFALLLLLLFVWFQWKLILVAFAGILLAILLHAIVAWIQYHTRLSGVISYVITLLLVALVVTVVVGLLAPRALTQLSEVADQLPRSIHQVRGDLHKSTWGNFVLRTVDNAGRGANLGGKFTAMFSAVLASLADLIAVVVIGFFVALSPNFYIKGIVSLVPPKYRARFCAVGGESLTTLRWWLIGQMIPMVALGISSMIALWALGVHMEFILGLLTGLMVFVPYVGSVLSGIPAILIGLQRGPHTALYVFLLYCCFHLVEGYLLTPMVQKKAVRLPPALTILTQFFMWSFAGILGVALAAPLTAVGLVLVKELYLKPSQRQ